LRLRLNVRYRWLVQTLGVCVAVFVHHGPECQERQVQECDSDQFARFTLKMGPAEPYHILSMSLMATSRPAAFPIPRLTESEAVAAVKALKRMLLASGIAIMSCLLLGVVVERVTGQSYYDYVQDYIYFI
jgi:hypothetical protein